MNNEQKKTVTILTEELVEILTFGKRADNTIAAYKTYAVPFMEYCFDELDKSPFEANEKRCTFLSHQHPKRPQPE